MSKKSIYDQSNIKVLSARDALKKRPGMYIGDIQDGTGIQSLLQTILDYSLDAVNKGQCNQISIIIQQNNEIEVNDNSFGLPVNLLKDKTAIETMMLQIEPNFQRFGKYHIGLMAINVFSSHVTIKTAKDGCCWHQEFKNEKPGPLIKTYNVNHTGTNISFMINKYMFPNAHFAPSKLVHYLKHISYLYDGLKIDFEDRRIRSASFHNPQGLRDCVVDLYSERHKQKTANIFETKAIENDIKFKAAFSFTDEIGEILSFVNDHQTKHGGTHEQALIAGLAKAIKTITDCKLNSTIWKRYISHNIYAVISVHLENPQYSQDRSKLLSKNIFNFIKENTYKQLMNSYLDNKPFFDELSKDLISQLINSKWQKDTGEYPLASSKYVKRILTILFNNPQQHNDVLDDFVEFEVNPAECHRLQELEERKEQAHQAD